VFVINNTHHY